MKLKVIPSDKTTQMLFTTTFISAELADGFESIGTGFFYNSRKQDYLITNKHVINGAVNITFPIHNAAPNNPKPQYANLGKYVTHTTKLDQWYYHPDPEIDLCCIPVDEFLLKEKTHDGTSFYIPISYDRIPDQELLERMPAIMDVVMVGYPHGFWDKANGLPIIRQGSTASHPSVSFNNRHDVILDIACFVGSSGSPVMLQDPKWFASTSMFLGVVYSSPAFTNEGTVEDKNIYTSIEQPGAGNNMMHLGRAISAKVVQQLVEGFEILEEKH